MLARRCDIDRGNQGLSTPPDRTERNGRRLQHDLATIQIPEIPYDGVPTDWASR
jgi:hypothetical protein